MSEPANAGERHGREDRGRWRPGVSGNRAGMPRGARHKATREAEALLDGAREAGALTRRALELALEGDTTALRLCMERVLPARRDAPVNVDLPRMETAEDAAKAMGALVEAVAAGALGRSEAMAVASLVETYRKTQETSELADRVAALEGNKR